MPKFAQLKPEDVRIGRERAAVEARQPYVAALKASDAGQIDLERGDVASTVKRRVAEAAAEIGVKVRSSWVDDKHRTLVWKKSAGARRGRPSKK